MITTLNDSQARELLQAARVARLGCIVNGEPYITPINYNFEDDCVYSPFSGRFENSSSKR